MSVLGFDFGNERCVVAVASAREKTCDVIGETPAIVCFGEKQRFIGTAAAASTIMNPENSISQLKLLIGRQFSDPELQRDIKSLPFSVTEGPDGYPLIHARYLGESKTFTPTQVLGMVLSHLKGIAERKLNAAVVDCCIGIPFYFTDFQRRAVLDAATIAGLRPLRLIHETTATALAYGIYRSDLPENPLNVAFVDMGHASMQVCIAGFKKGQLKILANSFDRSLGGRAFDEVLFQHFSNKFIEEYKIDVSKNPRACAMLMAACEKLKRSLSVRRQASLNIEVVVNEKGVSSFIKSDEFELLMNGKGGFLKRDEFEKISAPILERVTGLLGKALADAGLSVEDVRIVKLVGSGTEVPGMRKILTEIFGKKPSLSMYSSELVARGCAMECAFLSSTLKVPQLQLKVNEGIPFPIALSWKRSGPDTRNGAADNQQSTILFPKGNLFPSVKALTFYRSSTFTVHAQYADVSDLQTLTKISTYTIGPFQSTKSEPAKLKVKVRLNQNGIVAVESARLLEEEEIEVPVTKEPAKESTKMDTDEAPTEVPAPSSNETDVNMQDAKETADAQGVENGFPESGDKSVQMETDAKVEAPKRKVKKTNIPVSEFVFGGMLPTDLQMALEMEKEMALQDQVTEETKDKKNAVKAYVFDMRNKLSDKYQEFVTPLEREEFTVKLKEVEDWLCGDGEDETKGVYITKLNDLKKEGDPIEERYKDYTERGPTIDLLMFFITIYGEAAMLNYPEFDHIETAEKQEVLNKCVAAEAWLTEKKQQLDSLSLPKHATPVLLSADVRKKAEALDRFCRPIMTKPKPTTLEATPTPPPLHFHFEDMGWWETSSRGIY